MKNKPINLIFGILMIVALVGGVWLVGQNQETRRGAYFAGTKMLIMPEDITAKVGSNLVAQLLVDTEAGAKLSAVDTVLCYGKGLELDSETPDKQVLLNTDALKDLVDVSLEKVGENNCVRIVALAGATMKPANLKSGMVRVANIRFVTTEKASGRIWVLPARTKIGGYNPKPGATDNSLKISSVAGAKYVITDEVTEFPCGWCGSSCTRLDPAADCSSERPPEGKVCKEVNNKCVIQNDNGCGQDSDCDDGYYCSTNKVCLPSEGGYLKFRTSFYGVRSDALCADAEKMPLSVTVRSQNGVTKTYANVLSKKVSDTSSVGIYEVSLKLDGFPYRDNLAVFVKSPKSLQVKYGKNGQGDFYNVSGGELSGLSDNLSSTPVFAFEKYPLLAGDVTGPDGKQDGVIDGLDFSYIKTEAVKRTEVSAHEYMPADLNGNCKMESQDLSNMMLSLSVKQGQLY